MPLGDEARDELAEHEMREEVAADEEGGVQGTAKRRARYRVRDARCVVSVTVDCVCVEVRAACHGADYVDVLGG